MIINSLDSCESKCNKRHLLSLSFSLFLELLCFLIVIVTDGVVRVLTFGTKKDIGWPSSLISAINFLRFANDVRLVRSSTC